MVAEVKRAGGIAAIIAFTPAAVQGAGYYPREFLSETPFVAVSPEERVVAIREAKSPLPTATISVPFATYDNTAPRVVGFSSRGPAYAVNQLVLKPDIAAPGDLQALVDTCILSEVHVCKHD